MARSSLEAGRERVTARSEIDERFPGLPSLVGDWLVGQPGILGLLSQIEQRLRDGSLSHEGLIHLAKRWSEKLPPRRGVVVNLREIVRQPELPIDLLEPLRRVRRRGRRKPSAK